MLIYNASKEFVGIDENDLKTLGFSNLAELRSESADFADLFVKTPGCVHNFKHVHWIDFIDYAESSAESKVIISAKSKSYTANLGLTKAYLTDKPTSKAYLISLNNLRALSAKESENISEVLSSKPAPASVRHIAEVEEVEEVAPQKIDVPYKANISDEFGVEDEPSYIDEPSYVDEPVVETREIVEETYDLPLDVDFEEKEIVVEEKIVLPIASPKKEEFEDDGYVFDPKVASEELGLPVDLIEEFIQDFIAQAKEFKDELYASLSDGDIENIARLSHKLKGVAANLRVVNALETLAIVNMSKNIDEIKPNLDKFYRIIQKLSGEEEKVEEVLEAQLDSEEDDFALEFKDEEIEKPVRNSSANDTPEEDDDLVLEFKDDAKIKDFDAPQTIETLEVAENDLAEPKKIQSEYSKKLIANKIGLDYEAFEELFGDYVAEAREVSLRIHQALSENDFGKCKKESVLLKGMSESMHMKEFAPELEFLINSSDKAEMTNAINKIDDIIEQNSK